MVVTAAPGRTNALAKPNIESLCVTLQLGKAACNSIKPPDSWIEQSTAKPSRFAKLKRYPVLLP